MLLTVFWQLPFEVRSLRWCENQACTCGGFSLGVPPIWGRKKYCTRTDRAESEQNCSLQSATPQRGRYRGEALVGCAPSADLMRMWPISTRANRPEIDDPSIVEPIEVATDVA